MCVACLLPQEKSLGGLCRRFVQLFLVGNEVVSVGEAAEKLSDAADVSSVTSPPPYRGYIDRSSDAAAVRATLYCSLILVLFAFLRGVAAAGRVEFLLLPSSLVIWITKATTCSQYQPIDPHTVDVYLMMGHVSLVIYSPDEVVKQYRSSSHVRNFAT